MAKTMGAARFREQCLSLINSLEPEGIVITKHGSSTESILAADLEICRAICRLDVRADPAAELIAGTSLVHNVPLVTRDKALRRSKQIPLARLQGGDDR